MVDAFGSAAVQSDLPTYSASIGLPTPHLTV